MKINSFQADKYILLDKLKYVFLTLLLIFGQSLSAQSLGNGTFISKSNGISAQGTFQIIEDSEGLVLTLPETFKVSSGPDLFFVFHPLKLSAINDNNAKTNALRINPKLKKISGADTYILPSDINLNDYQTLLIHCWQFNHLYAGAELKLTPIISPIAQDLNMRPAPHPKKSITYDVIGKKAVQASKYFHVRK